MNPIFRPAWISIITAILFTCARINAGEPTGALRNDIKTQRVLILGNSITRHGVLEKIGWTTDWGMAASAQEKDFVHLIAHDLEELSGQKCELKIGNIGGWHR